MSKQKAGKTVSVDKEEEKAEKARRAAAERAGKKKKGNFKLHAVIAVGVAVGLLAVFLAVTGPSSPRKGGYTPYDAYVNDRSLISDVTAKAEGNFTAAGSSFFNRFTLNDVKYGLDGVTTSNMIGLPGAVQYCEGEDDMEGGAIPSSYDVRTNYPGCFGDVVDMGNCSSSYAIAAAEALAARFCIGDNAKYGALRLSSQQILSCDKKSQGCDGGVIDGVWPYIQRRGLYPEECVPYVGVKGPQCSKDLTKCEDSKKVKAIDHCVISNEKRIKREIFNKGPVVAPIYLKTDYLVYSSGVYTPTTASEQVFGAGNEAIQNAVSLIGWGKSQGTPYWIVRHSWGSGWGENGYARVAMDTIVRESYTVAPIAGTEENIAIAEKKKEEAELRKEEEKKERAARDARIAAKRAEREAQKAAEKEASDLKEMDEVDADEEDFEAEVDLDAEA
jgi:hypothetical protein